MAIMEYTREARCLDCKYYVPAPKWIELSICKFKNKLTNRRNLVCKYCDISEYVKKEE